MGDQKPATNCDWCEFSQLLPGMSALPRRCDSSQNAESFTVDLLQKSKNIQKKVRRVTACGFSNYRKATVIKTMWSEEKERHLSQCHSLDSAYAYIIISL